MSAKHEPVLLKPFLPYFLRPRSREAGCSMAKAQLFASSLAACTLLQGAEKPALIPFRIESRIHLDGRLDEPAWAKSQSVSLTQQAPVPGGASAYSTTVRALVTSQGVYFGVRCEDPDPNRIVTHTLQRDGDFSSDDMVSLVLDTLGDGRTAYLFQLNALGAQADGLVSGPESLSLDWDGLWETAVSRDERGWTAEVFLPSRTLRFDPSQNPWNLNVERFVARERMTLRWASPILDAKFPDMARSGLLDGMKGLDRGSGLSITPYLSAIRETDFPNRSTHVKVRGGLDVAVPVSNQLSGMLTYRPDFAETEVDARQINLTRFQLFFPEKRSFFLEGSNQFQFGIGLGGVFVPFFSRTIGLVNGEPITLDGGGKLLGRVGPVSVGALSVHQQASQEGKATTLSAARVNWDLNEHLRIGAIGTHGDPTGLGTNRLTGVDSVWQTSRLFGDKLFLVGVWGARSEGTTVPKGDADGYGFKIDYPNDLWDVKFVFNRFGEAMNPAMGFLPRPGTRQMDFGMAYQPRPSSPRWNWIRQAFFEFEASRVLDLSGNIQSESMFTAPINFRNQAGDHFEVNWAPERQVITEPFEISKGVVVPAGDYRFNRYRFEVISSPSRTWQAGITLWNGDFYGGRLLQWIQTLGWNAQDGHIRMTLKTENDFARLPWGNFVQRMIQLKGEYAWSPHLILSGFLQYDTESQRLGSNLRLRWTLKPGVEAFFVWNRGWLRPDLNGPLRLLPLEETLSFKFRWTFRP